MITWDPPSERLYEHGLDRGVLYIRGRDPIAFNGLTGFDENAEGASVTMYYRDGVVYLADADASDFTGKLTSIFYPDAFHECIGMPEATDGLYVGNQKPKQFDMSYRTLIGSGTKGDRFGYQIHLLYNCMASINGRSRRTINSSVEVVEFAFDIVCTPVKLSGYRPTAHYVIDTRNMSASTVAELEGILYGNGSPGRLPTPTELYDLMNFGDTITYTVHADGTYTVVGSYENVHEIDDIHFQMNNVNGVDNGDGTYVISSGGTTAVVLE